MSDPARERPAIHVCLAGPSQPGLYRWVEVGAEEEGLPTRHVCQGEAEVVAAAFAAAQSSRFGIGVGIGEGRVVLHEAHMPPERPVLAFELGEDASRACRLMGGNAARLVVRLPLRLDDELEPPEAPAPSAPVARQQEAHEELDLALVARVTTIVARILRERGVL